jgi:hypothetical protein
LARRAATEKQKRRDDERQGGTRKSHRPSQQECNRTFNRRYGRRSHLANR